MKYRYALLLALAALATACDKAPKPAAKAPAAAQQAAQPPGPPLTDGVYVAHHACPGEGCEFGRWRATKAVALYAEPNDKAAAVATLTPGERVTALTGELYLKPLRGVLVRDLPAGEMGNEKDLKKGEVIHILGYEGEGQYNVWRGGEILTLEPNAQTVRLDADMMTWPKAVWWVRLKRDGGQEGWVRNPDSFECVGKLAGDLDC